MSIMSMAIVVFGAIMLGLAPDEFRSGLYGRAVPLLVLGVGLIAAGAWMFLN